MRAHESWHRESAHAYKWQICRSGSYRLILCRDGIQFIIQRLTRGNGGPHGGQWRAVAYCKARSTALRLWRARVGETHPALAALPERITACTAPALIAALEVRD